MLNLILHCGGQAVGRSVVVHCRTPADTNSWQPIPHGRLLDLVEDSLEATGMKVVNQAHALARDENRYFGLLEVQNGKQSSGLRLTVYNLFSTRRARLTLARMSLAEAVQMKGLGFSLCALMYSVIAPIRSLTL